MSINKTNAANVVIILIVVFGVVLFLGSIWYWALVDNGAGEAITAGFFTCVACVISAIVIHENT